MAKRRAAFQMDDVKRALAGAHAAGEKVHSMVIEPSGKIILDFTPENASTRGQGNGWDKKIKEVTSQT